MFRLSQNVLYATRIEEESTNVNPFSGNISSRNSQAANANKSEELITGPRTCLADEYMNYSLFCMEAINILCN